jgi:hypothetical protein
MLLFDARRALLTGPHPPGSSRLCRLRGSTTGSPRVTPSCLASRTRAVWQTDPSRRCQGCSHPAWRLPGRAALSLSRAAATAQRWALSPHPVTQRPVTHALISMNLARPRPPMAAGRAHRRQVVQQRGEQRRVVRVGGGQQDRQRDPAGLGGEVELAAGLAAVGGVCAGVASPFAARRLTESTLTRDQSRRPASPSASSRTRLSRSNTPARVHSVKRRQTVEALPQPSSRAGSSCQGVEVRAMNTTAAKQARSGILRPGPPLDRAVAVGAGAQRGARTRRRRDGRQELAYG